MVNHILDYWYAMEHFNPCWPVDAKKDINLTRDALPWLDPPSNPTYRVSHAVYFGKVSTTALARWFQEELNTDNMDATIENGNAVTCIFALKVDENGRYIPRSFAISTLVWAICTLVSQHSHQLNFTCCELELLQTQLEQQIASEQQGQSSIITKSALQTIYERVCRRLHLPEKLTKYEVWSSEHRDYANKEGTFPPLNPATELIQSFYLNDIKQVQEHITEPIHQYISAFLDTQAMPVHIDCDTVQMRTWVQADRFPFGAWPSPYSPSLMQQLAINLAISNEQTIFSVNGPPGTGKTTLLKEIVASNVIQRAIAMMSYHHPDDAFHKRLFEHPIDSFNQTFYELDASLSCFGMLVASNNNAAVENISIELPKQINADRTGHFSVQNKSFAENSYFSEIASGLVEAPCWGLVSAKLGKKDNIKKLVNRLWWAKDQRTLKHYYDADSCDSLQACKRWTQAKHAFQTALDAVIAERSKISHAQDLLQQKEDAQVSLQLAQSDEAQKHTSYLQSMQTFAHIDTHLAELEIRLRTEEETCTRLKAKIPAWKRTFRTLLKQDDIVLAWNKSNALVLSLEIELAELKRRWQDARSDTSLCKSAWDTAAEAVAQQSHVLQAIQDQLVSYEADFGPNWADHKFWNDISRNEASQSACPWTTASYDKLREELFYRALMLHKAFILHSNAVKQNLNRLFSVWDDKITGESRTKAYAHLFNTLQLLIPVVSTTFASVQSFLDGIGPEQLGMLIIDEAGQATPQSALGSLWRTKRAIIVGDPLQVEPIVTIPKALQIQFADASHIPPVYRLPELSVQMLADRMNRFGGERTINGTTMWLGCPLVVHRRCLDPMFTISNEVAYNGKMFSKTQNSTSGKTFLLDSSVWLDCKGPEQGNRNHSVLAQIELSGQLFQQALDTYHGFPDLYFITPFTSVALELSKKLRKIIKQRMPSLDDYILNDWIRSHCGTVHTFQGKEAAEVLFILGCDSGSGIGAARWVGQKPNIVNVAVSRAKYRLGVIGDYTLWNDIPSVRTICDHIPVIPAKEWMHSHSPCSIK